MITGGIASPTSILLCFFLYFLFTFSYARIPLKTDDVITSPNTNSFSVSKNNPSTPIEKPNTLIEREHQKTSEPNTLIQREPQKTSEPKPESTVDLTESSSNGLPMTVFSSHPRIPRRPLPLRIRHRCRLYKPWKPQPRQSNYHIAPRGGVRHVARGWTRFGHVQPIVSRQRGMYTEKNELLKKLSRRHHHERDEPAQIKVNTGFVKRIRKFLNHF